MPDTTSRPATATPQKWPPLTPVDVVAVPRWLAWSLIGLALVLVAEIGYFGSQIERWTQSAAVTLSRRGASDANDDRQGDELRKQAK